MEKIIFYILLISYIFCDLDICEKVDDMTKCTTTKTNINGLSCYKVKLVDDDDNIFCYEFPDSNDGQKAYWKINAGMDKDTNSRRINNDYDEIYIGRKETYENSETIELIPATWTENDKKIFNEHNTCAYLYYGRYIDNKSKYSTGYPDITDKNTCFNADQFEDLKNLVDCGYAEMTFTEGTVQKSIKTCFYIPNDNMPKDVEIILNSNYLKDYLNDIYKILYEVKDSERRRLSSINYEVVVEDKNGKKVKYTSDSDEIVNVEVDTEKKKSSCGILKFNIFLFFSLLLLI